MAKGGRISKSQILVHILHNMWQTFLAVAVLFYEGKVSLSDEGNLSDCFSTFHTRNTLSLFYVWHSVEWGITNAWVSRSQQRVREFIVDALTGVGLKKDIFFSGLVIIIIYSSFQS